MRAIEMKELAYIQTVGRGRRGGPHVADTPGNSALFRC
jgi:hypothetical protein